MSTKECFKNAVQRIGDCVARVNIANNDGRFLVKTQPVEILTIQYTQQLPCINTGKLELIKGRKWLISVHMTEEEIFHVSRDFIEK